MFAWLYHDRIKVGRSKKGLTMGEICLKYGRVLASLGTLGKGYFSWKLNSPKASKKLPQLVF